LPWEQVFAGLNPAAQTNFKAKVKRQKAKVLVEIAPT